MSLQVDVACIQETKLLPTDKTPEIQFVTTAQYSGGKEWRTHHLCTRYTGILCYLSNCRDVQHTGEIGSGNSITRAKKNQGQQLVFTHGVVQLSTKCRLLTFCILSRTATVEIICADLSAHDPLCEPVPSLTDDECQKICLMLKNAI